MAEVISFGKWVQNRRNQLGLTRKGLAELVVCSPVTIKKIERDERRPSSQIAELLAQHLQLPESERESFMARARGEFVANFILPTELSLEEAQAAASEDETPRHNLPHQPTSFFGRVQELAEIASQLANPNCRLLTILGAGGMGKTRLSIEAARAQVGNFTDGITFVELAPIDANRSEGEINPLASVLADALGLGFHGESPPEQQLSDYLSRREMLIVYDNFEHLVETAVLLSALLSHAPDVKILVTSRERLNLQEEWLFALQGLSTPSSNLQTSDAVQFFIERAKQAKSSFDGKAELAGIERVCQLVAGMPLGIELSASWVLQLSCEEIADEIEEELDFLTTEMRNVPDRHRSVRAVWEYSWEKLTAKEQEALKKLSVFRGGLERPAAKAVAGASLSILAKLVSKSLLSVEENGRYAIHELLRQFAAEKLAANPADLAEAQLQHSHYYLTFIANQEPNLTEETRDATLGAIEESIDNIRLAIKHAAIHTPSLFSIPINFVLFIFYTARSWVIEHEQLLQLITTALKPDCLTSQKDGAESVSSACLTWAVFQVSKGYRQARQGQGEEGEKTIREGLEVLPPNAPDPYAIRGWGLYWLSWSIGVQGNYPKAIQSLEESVKEFENNDWPILKRSMYSRLGEYYMQVGDFEQAAQWFDRIFLEQLPLEGSQYFVMGILAQFHGNYEKAERFFQTAYDAPGNSPIELISFNFSLGIIARLQGDLDKAGDYLQQGIQIATEYNLPLFVHRGRWCLGELAVASGDFQTALGYFPNHDLGVWYATGSPGWAHLGLENLDDARVAFEKSLQKTVISHTRPFGLHALVGMAHLHARAGDMRRALQLLALVRNHQSSTFEAKEKAKELWIELVAELPEEVVTEAERTGQTLNLFAVVKALLANDDDVDSWSATANLDQISDTRRYKPGELLAEGGHGQVYLGQDSETGQAVVIKQLKPELQERDDLVARFLRESETLSQLNHPNIVQMVDSFEENDRHHIVMEFVPGGSLRDLLEKNGQLPQIQCLDIALELADALSRAHHLGILHRDLKPGNVLLAADGTPRLTDFGIARLVQEDVKLTATGSFLGSPAYMSPEAVLGETFDHRGDIWSFGVLLYEMLAGKRPFASEPLTAVLAAILNDPVPAIEQFIPNIHPDLAALLAHMLQKAPENRPNSMRQIAATLESIRKEMR